MGHAGGRQGDFQSTNPKVFFGGDAAFGPKNIIWAVAHGHDAAVSIDKLLKARTSPSGRRRCVNLISQKMGIHEWSYDNDIANDQRYKVPLGGRRPGQALKPTSRWRWSWASTSSWPFKEAQRCLNCDVQTVFDRAAVHRVRRLRGHLPDGLHHLHARTARRRSCARASSAPAQNLTQDLYVSAGSRPARIMAKDEDVCLHCGLCAERCPTGAWDMQKSLMMLERRPHRLV